MAVAAELESLLKRAGSADADGLAPLVEVPQKQIAASAPEIRLEDVVAEILRRPRRDIPGGKTGERAVKGFARKCVRQNVEVRKKAVRELWGQTVANRSDRLLFAAEESATVDLQLGKVVAAACPSRQMDDSMLIDVGGIAIKIVPRACPCA